MNEDPVLYERYCKMQRKVVSQVLEENLYRIKWKSSKNRILDIGCGDGSITMNTLRNYLPDHYEKIVGCDISKIMVEHCREHYGGERTEFIHLDIGGDIPKNLLKCFDNIFSFFALHWVKDQTQVFRNVYKLMADGGDCLLLILGHHPFFEVYRELGKDKRWHRYVNKAEDIISPYHDNQISEKEIHEKLEEIGFQNVTVKKQQVIQEFDDDEELRQFAESVTPFKIPDDLKEDYNQCFLAAAKKVTNNDAFNMNFTIVIVYAYKQ